jgi:hypothetical protein
MIVQAPMWATVRCVFAYKRTTAGQKKPGLKPGPTRCSLEVARETQKNAELGSR